MNLVNQVEKYFLEISSIPRPSGQEKAVSDYLAAFAEKQGLVYLQDQANNVIIKKEAQGRADRQKAATVILQAHLDMVCVPRDCDWSKGVDTEIIHDHEKGRIMRGRNPVTGEYTSLGADNGIGVAMIMGILADRELVHPPVLAVLTTDEEAGMSGAKALKEEDIRKVAGELDLGKARLINLDEEQDGQFGAGCAGGIRAELRLPVRWEEQAGNFSAYQVSVNGLTGGHSGLEIDKQRANAHCLMGRVLDHLQRRGISFALSELFGGEFDNAIARFSHAKILVAGEQTVLFEESIKEIHGVLDKEYNHIRGYQSEPSMTVSLQKISPFLGGKACSGEDLSKIITILTLLPNGVLAMDLDAPGLVETSSNLGVIQMEGELLRLICAVRSSVASRKHFVVCRMRRLIESMGGELIEKSEYPGWEYREKSELREVFIRTYQELFPESRPVAKAIHAGLECGFFTEKLGDMDMIAFGPTMSDVHTTKETLYLDTVSRAVELLAAVLARLSESS